MNSFSFSNSFSDLLDGSITKTISARALQVKTPTSLGVVAKIKMRQRMKIHMDRILSEIHIFATCTSSKDDVRLKMTSIKKNSVAPANSKMMNLMFTIRNWAERNVFESKSGKSYFSTMNYLLI